MFNPGTKQSNHPTKFSELKPVPPALTSGVALSLGNFTLCFQNEREMQLH
jgi:hypothetical protein